MPAKINISQDDIKYAEKILFPDGGSFDDEFNERIDFIKCFETLDLLAVPGSGKTTALLAKLLILETKLPFEDGSGILVLSHTNVAIDEIKKKIGTRNKLFSYPNFIGTIQSFVDQYLAVPCGHSLLNTRFSFIDSEKYSREILLEFESIKWTSEYEKPNGIFFGKFYSRACIDSLQWDVINAYADIKIKEVEKIIDDVQKNKIVINKIDAINDEINKLIKQKTSKDSIPNLMVLKKKDVDSVIEKLTLETVSGIYHDYINSKICGRNGEPIVGRFKSKGNEENKRYLGLKFAVENVLRSGIISYDYAYEIGKYYLQSFPILKKLLQKRFRYVFVDEMQDMELHQYEIIEAIFFDNGNSESYLQRIGDKNQSIYGGIVETKPFWKDRNPVMYLSGSYRLSKLVADIVNSFALESKDKFKIVGLSECKIRPHLIVYGDNSKTDVLNKFGEFIKQYQGENKIPINPKYPFKAVCWNTDWPDAKEKDDFSKNRLTDFYPLFSKETAKLHEDYDALKKYIYFTDRNKKTLGPVRKSILNALLKVLRLEEIRDSQKRNYTKRKLLEYMQELDRRNQTDNYESLKLNIYKWSIAIIRNKEAEVFSLFKSYIKNDFVKILNFSISNKSNQFIENNQEIVIQKSEEKKANIDDRIIEFPSKLLYKGIEIQLGSVHSAKGHTHTATLYFESSFHDSYESERLLEQLSGKTFTSNKKAKQSYHIQSAKMMYVGLSRPTHLLCFAIHKDRYDAFEKDVNNIWEVKKIYSD